MRVMPEADTKRSLRLVVVLGLAGFSSSLATRVLDPLVAVLGDEFGAAADSVALLASAFALPYALIQPLLGPLGDSLGKRRVILWCCLALTVTLMACALAPSLPLLFLARALSGAAGGGIFPLSFALIGDNVPMAKRQVALSRFLVFGISGQISGGFMAALLAPLLGWRGVLAVCALAALAGLLVLWRAKLAAEAPAPFDPGQALRRYAAILRNPIARTCYFGVFAEGCLIFGLFPFLAPLLYARGLGGTQAAGFAIASFGAGGFLFVLLAPLLVARLGPARMLRAGGAIAALCMAMLAAAGSVGAVLGATLLLGTAFFMMHNSIQTRVTEVAPAARGSAVALHAFAFFVGQSLGPPLFGAGTTLLGPPATLLLCGAGLLALGPYVARRLGSLPKAPGNTA